MLNTETNTPEMAERIRGAFCGRFYLEAQAPIQADFEHGQWWITNLETGAQWAVVDAEGGESVDGFDFEQVTEGS